MPRSAESPLEALGLVLVVSNVVLQFLDGATSFMALGRGFVETNPYTLWLMGELGNGYLGVGAQAVAFVALFVLVHYLARAVARFGDGGVRVVGLAVVDVALLFFALSFSQAVLSNVSVMA